VKVAYEKGLHELGDGLFAYLQPDGGWGWSNAGLISHGTVTDASGVAMQPCVADDGTRST
jgi:hypothetical protein